MNIRHSRRLSCLSLALCLPLVFASVELCDGQDVAILSTLSGNIDSNLAGQGFSVTRLTPTDVESGALTAGNFDVFIYGRNYLSFPAGSTAVSSTFLNQVDGYLNSGGGIITEWDGASSLFSGYHSTYRYSPSAPQLGLFSGDIGAGQFMGSFAITNSISGHEIWTGLPNSFFQSGVEFPYTLYNFNTAELDVVATFQGSGSLPNFPNQTFPAVVAGRNVNAVGLLFDWQDNSLNDPNSLQLVSNAINYLTSMEQLSLSTNSVDFGKQLVGTTSASQRVNAQNTGEGLLSGAFNAVGGVDPSQFQSGTGAAKAFDAVTITFDDISSGSLNGLFLTENGARVESLQDHLHSGTGTSGSGLFNHSSCCSTPYEFTLISGNPFDLLGFDFVNMTGTNTFTDSNGAMFTVGPGSGTQGAPGSGFVDITSFQWNTSSNGNVDDVALGGSETFAFAPTSVGLKNAEVSVTSNGGDQTVSLTGEGVAPISTAFDETNNNAGFVLVGTTGTASVSITNIGNGNESGVAGSGVLGVPGGGSNLNGMISSGAGEFTLSGSSSVSLADGETGTFNYNYTPTSRGADSEALGAIFGNGNPDGTNTGHARGFTVAGQGVAPVQSTTETDAGFVRVGTSGAASVDVTNIGDGNLATGGPSGLSNLNGSASGLSGEFSGAGGGFSLADGTSTSIPYSYTPAALGADSANVTVSFSNGSSDGTNSADSATVTLNGTGVGPVFAFEINDHDASPRSGTPQPDGTDNGGSVVVTGQTIDVGQIDWVSGPGTSQAGISLSNVFGMDMDGLTDLQILDVLIDGPDADQFQIFHADGTTPFDPFNDGAATLEAGGSDLDLIVEVGLDGTGTIRELEALITFFTDQGAALGGDGADFQFALAAVQTPEPATAAVWLLLGLAAFAFARRRRSPVA